MPTHIVWNIFVLLKTNMAVVWNFDIVSFKSNVGRICASVNYAQKWITKLYYYINL
jgi:hypothetical protein